jgi:hypothetical protein
MELFLGTYQNSLISVREHKIVTTRILAGVYLFYGLATIYYSFLHGAMEKWTG